MKYLVFLLLLPFTTLAQNKDEQAILKILDSQSEAWNRADIEGYMQGYWNDDSLVFIGKSGPTYGYKATMERYKKAYATPEQMGKLLFTILKVKRLSAEYYSVIGKWELARTAGDLNGHFSLLFRKIKGQWVIISDHSS
jgi:ketosteroid isomerase-like protein